MKRAYADIPEGQIHYRTGGSGEPILLLHMAGGCSDEYTRVIPFLSKSYRAIAPDFLGYGESDKPPSEYQVPDHAQTVISFMDSLGIEKASVVGHHGGAQVGVELAVTWPHRVDKLVLSSLPHWREKDQAKAMFKDAFFSRVEIRADGSHLTEWWNRANLTVYAGPHAPETPLEIIEERAFHLHKAGPRGEELHWASFNYGPEHNKKLPLIKCPTLVLSATRDRFYPMVEDIKRLIPRSRIAIIENGAVWVTSVMPKEFAEAILKFLESPGV